MQSNRHSIDAIEARYRQWMTAIRDRDLASIIDIYAEGATYMPPGRSSCVGKNAIQEAWAGYLQRDGFEATYLPTLSFSEAGDVAYDIGRYSLTMRKDGVERLFSGKYVVVWKLVGDEWKVVVDIDNDNGVEVLEPVAS